MVNSADNVWTFHKSTNSSREFFFLQDSNSLHNKRLFIELGGLSEEEMSPGSRASGNHVYTECSHNDATTRVSVKKKRVSLCLVFFRLSSRSHVNGIKTRRDKNKARKEHTEQTERKKRNKTQAIREKVAASEKCECG